MRTNDLEIARNLNPATTALLTETTHIRAEARLEQITASDPRIRAAGLLGCRSHLRFARRASVATASALVAVLGGTTAATAAGYANPVGDWVMDRLVETQSQEVDGIRCWQAFTVEPAAALGLLPGGTWDLDGATGAVTLLGNVEQDLDGKGQWEINEATGGVIVDGVPMHVDIVGALDILNSIDFSALGLSDATLANVQIAQVTELFDNGTLIDGGSWQNRDWGRVALIRQPQDPTASREFVDAVEAEFRARLAANGIDPDSVVLGMVEGCDTDAVIGFDRAE